MQQHFFIQIRLNEEVKAIGGRQDESENAKKYLIEVSTSFRENTDKVTSLFNQIVI